MTDGWFADVTDDEALKQTEFRWQAFLQAPGGCYPLPIWFPSEEAVVDFIKRDVIGKGLMS